MARARKVTSDAKPGDAVPDLTGCWLSTNWMRDAAPFGGPPAAFRKDFSAAGNVSRAVVHISASETYVLWLNGAWVGAGPARSFPSRQACDVYDLTHLVRSGINHFAALLVPPTGVTGYSAAVRFGLFFGGHVLAERNEASLSGGEGWRARDADWYHATGLLSSLPTGAQEHWDARQEPPFWRTAPAEQGWDDAFVLGPAATPPWREIVPRDIPCLVESDASPALVWAGVAPRDMADVGANLAAAFNAAAVTGQPVQQQKSEEWLSEEWLSTDERSVFVFDFGRTRSVRPALEAADVRGDVRLELFYSLALDERPRADRGFGTVREGFSDSAVFGEADNGARVWERLQPRGFRFLTVRAAGTGRCRFALRARTVEYPFPDEKPLACADAALQAIWSTSARTLRSCAGDVFVDTCARENVLWTLDACVAGEAAWHTFGETALWRRCLLLIAEGIDGGWRAAHGRARRTVLHGLV